MNTQLINKLFKKYDIANLPFGKIGDKLGDVYEEFLTIVMSDNANISAYNNNIQLETTEFSIFNDVLTANNITNLKKISSIYATTKVPHRPNGGNSKTDVIITIKFCDGSSSILPISSKQSTVAKVAMAEFDVDTISQEMGITDARLKSLLLKHQTDRSAKNFTLEEKNDLNNLMKPIARDFVRWVITGSKQKNPNNVVYPTSIIKYELKNEYSVLLKHLSRSN